MKLSKSQVVNDYLGALPESVKDLFLSIRAEILSEAPEFEEDIKWKNCLTYIYRGKNLIQTVLGKDKVSLIVHNGASLDDNSGLLEGDGNKTRTIRIHDMNFDQVALRKIIRKSIQACS